MAGLDIQTQKRCIADLLEQVEEMKAELKERSKKNKLSIAERKMEANKISSLQARIRNKMQNRA